MIRPSAALLALMIAALAEPPISDDARRELLAGFEKRKVAADVILEKSPKDADALSRRGDARLFLGDAKGAVADFEQEIAVDPSRDAPHWRLGIAYYFAGDFPKSARQFVKYQTYETGDRENGIWKYLAQAHVDGVDKARKEMIEYPRFDREPFPELYEMFAGKKSTADVLGELEQKGLKNDALVMFFAHYYIGLNEDLLGHADAAKVHLAEAVRQAVQAGADGGPGYMGQVARLHYEKLTR